MTFSNIEVVSYPIEPAQIRLNRCGKFSCYTLRKSSPGEIIEWYGKENLLWLKTNLHTEAWLCLVLKFNSHIHNEDYYSVRVSEIRTMLIDSCLQPLCDLYG